MSAPGIRVLRLNGDAPHMKSQRVVDAHLFVLFELLGAAMPTAPIHALDLSNNRIGNDGAKVLSDLLTVRAPHAAAFALFSFARRRCSLRALCLRYCRGPSRWGR